MNTSASKPVNCLAAAWCLRVLVVNPFLVLLTLLLLTRGLLVQAREMPKRGPRFDRVVIESLDPDAWNGVVFIAKASQQQISFGLRGGARRDQFLDGGKIFNAVSEVGPHVFWASSP